MNLWFVRHAPTHAKTMVGWTDLPADVSDSAAFTRLRAALPDAPLVSSDLRRAVLTGDCLQPKTRLPHDPRLREINFGDWENRTFQDVEADDPALIFAYWDTPGDVAPPNGEAWHQTASRVSAGVDGLAASGHSDLIIVAHFGAILTQVQRARNVTAKQAFAQKINNLSITQLHVLDGKMTEVSVNQIA